MIGRLPVVAVFVLFLVSSISAQDKIGSHVISGEFDTSHPVRVIAVANADTSLCIDLYRNTFTESYTMKIPAYPGIVIFFQTGSREKRIYIPHTIDANTHFHWVDVQFARRSHYLIYQSNKSREMDRVVID